MPWPAPVTTATLPAKSCIGSPWDDRAERI
jgi:hypothetical protein